MFFKKKSKNKSLAVPNVGNGDLESKLIKKANHQFWKTIFVAAIFLISIIVISCVINIYQDCYSINKYFGYTVLALMILAIVFFVIVPIIKVINAPMFTLDASIDKTTISNKNYRTLKSVAKNLVKSKNSIPTDVKKELTNCLSNRYELNKKLCFVYDKYIKKDIKDIIWSNSSKVACVTGLSKNSSFDALSTIICNIRMIMQIVVKCGYRPTYPKLTKLIIKVSRNALLAYSIQSINLGDIVFSCCEKFFKGLPGIGKPIASVLEGAANGFLTARVGAITRKYLYAEFKLQNKLMTEEQLEEQIAKEATIEAKSIIDESENTDYAA